MSPLLSRWRMVLVVVALAASWAVLSCPSAVAQTPTELWQQYPLEPETEPGQSGNDGEELRDERGDGAPLGDKSDAAAADEDSSPLLGIVLTLGLLLLVLGFGMGVRPRDWRVPKRLRDRVSAVWEPSPLYAAANERRSALSERPTTAPAEAKRSEGADATKKPSRPAKARRLPLRKKPPGKPAKPAGAVKPRRVSKPPRSGKPSEGGKPAGNPKLMKPAPSAKPGTTRIKPAPKPQRRRRKRSPGDRAAVGPVAEQSPQAVARGPRAVTCSIFGWREGEVADFYAVAVGLLGRDWIVERSPRFRWPAGPVPDEAYEAHSTLVDALLRAGWRPTGNEGAWYRQRFERAIEPVSERP